MSSDERTLLQISFFGRFRFSQPKAVSSPTRSRIVCASGSCNTNPERPREWRAFVPSINSSPSSSPSSSPPSTPARPAINVDFPAPEAPNSNTRSPGCMVKSTCLNAKSLREACRHPQSRATTPAAENGFPASVPMNRSFIPFAFDIRKANTHQRSPVSTHHECDTGLHKRIVRPEPAHDRIRNGQARLFWRWPAVGNTSPSRRALHRK